jgi:hypothetical protein
LAAALAETGTSIPRLLREQRELRSQVGAAEVEGGDIQTLRGRLDGVSNALTGAARQRAAASDGLLAMAGDLRAARAVAAEALTKIAKAAVDDFGLRWARATQELGRLIAEAGALAAALRTPVSTPAPYIPVLSPDGTKMLVSYSGNLRPDVVSLAPEVAEITHRLDAIDGALALAGAIAQSRELDERHHALCRQRRTVARMDGLYEAVKNFSYLGSEFARGMLIDRTVIPDGALYRCQVARELRAVEDSASAAA